MKIEESVLESVITDNLYPQSITKYMEEPGLIDSMVGLFKNTAAPTTLVALQIPMSTWSTLSTEAKKQAVIDALEGNTFNNMVKDYIESGTSSAFLRKISLVTNDNVAVGLLDFGINLATNASGKQIYQLGINSAAGIGADITASTVTAGVIGAAGISGLAAAAVPFIIGGIASYVVTENLNEMWDYNNNSIANNKKIADAVSKKGGILLQASVYDISDMIYAINHSGALDLPSTDKITVENEATGDKYELVRGDDYNNLIKMLKDRGFGGNDYFPGKMTDLYELFAANTGLSDYASDGHFGPLDFAIDKNYFLIDSERTLLLPYQGNNNSNLIYIPKELPVQVPIFGLDGNDTIIGCDLNDTIYGDDGLNSEDYVHYDNRVIYDNEATADKHDDLLYGGNDYILGGDGNDTILLAA